MADDEFRARLTRFEGKLESLFEIVEGRDGVHDVVDELREEWYGNKDKGKKGAAQLLDGLVEKQKARDLTMRLLLILLSFFGLTTLGGIWTFLKGIFAP